MSQVKGQVIMQRQDRKCPWAAILITEISVADNPLGISSQWPYNVYFNFLSIFILLFHMFILIPLTLCRGSIVGPYSIFFYYQLSTTLIHCLDVWGVYIKLIWID